MGYDEGLVCVEWSGVICMVGGDEDEHRIRQEGEKRKKCYIPRLQRKIDL